MGLALGKRSRLKHERRAAKAEMDKAAMSHDADFERTCNGLRALFARYAADDVIVSLNVSDLWLPNISSQVKHALAFAVSIAMAADSFKGTERIEAYSDFKQFIEQVYAILPSFLGLEDYVPETDWGEVKFPSKDSLLRIFYGGAVERIPDFITAFHLVHGGHVQANQDMHLALLTQDHVLTAVDRASAGVADDIETGHIEIPAEAFWRACRDAILSLSVRAELAGVSQGLVTKLGVQSAPKRRMDFGDGVIMGTALPAFLVEVGTHRFPLALRNAAATVIQHWAGKNNVASADAIADFVSARLGDVIKGPLKVITRTEWQPFIFSAVILGGAKPYLVIAMEEAELAQLPRLEAGLKKAVSSGEWVLQPMDNHGAIQIRTPDGVLSTIDQLVVIAVLSRVTTVSGILKIPRTTAHVLPLSDFVTIFDSIEDIKELDRYWAFMDAHSLTIGGFNGPADRFAAFRDSNALLADGALVPRMITLDPHWGSTWRYRMLKKYWDNAPPSFPDLPSTAWNVERDPDGLYKSLAKRIPALSWGLVVGNCVVHFMLVVGEQPIELDDGRILELLVQCLADVLNQRQPILSSLPLFKYRQIVTTCQAKMDSLVSQEDRDHSGQPLFSDWQVTENATTCSVHVVVQANLQHVQKHLADVTDASFEVAAAAAWIDGVSSCLSLTTDPAVLAELSTTATRKPRFMLKVMQRTIDVPDYASPRVPGPEHYKLARRDLAVAFKDLGAKEGKYELAAAKALIDPARDRFRALIHSRISSLRRTDLVQFCIEQLDALIVKYDREQTRIQISLAHEVSYDRTKSLAEAHEQFVKESRNYRYLLECTLSMEASGSDEVTIEAMVRLAASVDWLMVLYNASDVLHNGLDVAGLELDHFYIPHVYYSEITDHSETSFANEAADIKLGVGLRASDEVRAIRQTDPEWSGFDQAFKQDTGVSLNMFLTSLYVLSRWPSAINTKDLQFSYSAPRGKVCDVLVESITDMTPEDAEKVISLVSLDPKGIRRLLGKSTDEGDVPVWEHNKRGDRYTIKPLIQDEKGSLTWGAASMERAARIWRQTLANGYMPADFDWRNIKEAVRGIKARLDEQLETATATVLLRASPYAMKGIDFMRRFPKESFDDVGDFDGLAYWPETNQWVTAECKYNQPAFCLKDARRLRDRIFGTQANREQFAKIERRRAFLQAYLERIRTALGWPPPPAGLQPTVHELYVSRDIYWWMRNTPYPVPTLFVRVDSLDNWLRDKGLLRKPAS